MEHVVPFASCRDILEYECDGEWKGVLVGCRSGMEVAPWFIFDLSGTDPVYG